MTPPSEGVSQQDRDDHGQLPDVRRFSAARLPAPRWTSIALSCGAAGFRADLLCRCNIQLQSEGRQACFRYDLQLGRRKPGIQPRRWLDHRGVYDAGHCAGWRQAGPVHADVLRPCEHVRQREHYGHQRGADDLGWVRGVHRHNVHAGDGALARCHQHEPVFAHRCGPGLHPGQGLYLLHKSIDALTYNADLKLKVGNGSGAWSSPATDLAKVCADATYDLLKATIDMSALAAGQTGYWGLDTYNTKQQQLRAALVLFQ